MVQSEHVVVFLVHVGWNPHKGDQRQQDGSTGHHHLGYIALEFPDKYSQDCHKRQSDP